MRVHDTAPRAGTWGSGYIDGERQNHTAEAVPDPVAAFKAAMRDHGIETDDAIIPDGNLHRFHVIGDRPRSRNGWYCLHTDGRPAGAFGSHKLMSGHTIKWSANGAKKMSAAERRQYAESIRQRQRERVEAERQKQEDAAATAVRLWDEAHPATTHPYLQRKGVQPHRAKIGRWWRDPTVECLLIPIIVDGKLVSLQAIFAEPFKDGRDKDFLPGGRKQGGYCPIGPKPASDSKIVVCEGFATGASIHEATEHTVFVAFDAGNLEPVATALRARFPGVDIAIAADNDQWTKRPDGSAWNPGVESATKAAQAVNGRLVVPSFAANDQQRRTDFNDLARSDGPEVVRRAFCLSEEPANKDSEPPQAEIKTAVVGQEVDSDSSHSVEMAPPGAPMENARRLIRAKYRHADYPLLVRQGGQYYTWNGASWSMTEGDILRASAYAWSEHGWYTDEQTGTPKPFAPTARKVSDILDALAAISVIPSGTVIPSWLAGSVPHPAIEIIACSNGLLHWPTRVLLGHTPRHYSHHAIPFAFDPAAPPPKEWLKFLADLWGEDIEQIQTLQEVIGYLLSGDTSQQKIFLIVGRPRSGKGTIGRVIRSLIGQHNVAGPTLASMASNFGLQPLIGKPVAIVSDARLSAKADSSIVTERLLSISGEDALTVDRKYLLPWTGQLNARFVILTNELPRMHDASGALASRFIVLRTNQSFLGREDTTLTERLLQELPGILLWALDGLNRLNARGRFIQPSSTKDQVDALTGLSSPITTFLSERCELGSCFSVPKEQLFSAWKAWCEDNGHHATSVETFGRDLTSAADIRASRPRTDDGGRLRVYTGIRLTVDSGARDPALVCRRCRGEGCDWCERT